MDNTSEKKRVIPQAVYLEEKLLSAIMLDNEVMNDITDILKADHLYKKKHRIIYRAFLDMWENNNPIDPNTLLKWLDKKNLEVPITTDEVIDLSSAVSTSANVEFYARIIYEKYVLRYIISTSNELANNCLEPDVNTWHALEKAEVRLMELSQQTNKSKIICVGDEIESYLQEINERRSNKDNQEYIPTYIGALDEVITGLFKGNLIIIGARPKSGKTALAVTIGNNITQNLNLPVGMISAEMRTKEIMDRLISAEAGVTGNIIRYGTIRDSEYEMITDSIKYLKTKFYIDDSPDINIMELRAKARKMKKEYDIQLLIVDYLQLIKGFEKRERRDIEVGDVSKGLKSLAKELDIPVVACCQLNRAITSTGKPRKPILSDLRESGNIEQDADTIIFIHKPAIEDDHHYELHVAAQRNGPTGEIDIKFSKEFTKFESYNTLSVAANSDSEDEPF